MGHYVLFENHWQDQRLRRTFDLNLSIEAAAKKVADQFGLTATEVLAEARLFLSEVDDAH